MTEILFARKDDVDSIGSVDIIAGTGLSGGGDISGPSDITLNLDINELSIIAPALADSVAIYDASGATHGKADFTSINAVLVHDDLTGFVADEHIAHSSVVLTAGTGLAGGGDITVSRTFDLDLSDLTADTPVLSDTFAFFDVSGADTNKATLTVLNSILDHDALVNFVADEHVAHTGVVLTAGAGLTGGGDISVSRTFTVGAGTGITVNADDVALNVNGLTTDTPTTGDFIPFHDTSGGDVNKAAVTGTGNVVLATSPQFTTDIRPSANDGASIGVSGTAFSDAFLANGAVINFNAGNYTITHSAGDLAFSGIVTLPNSGLHVLDTNASHDLIITPGSDLTADRILTLTTGDAARTVTISGNTTISQDYSTTGNPQFATIELGAATDTTLSRASAGNVNIEGNLVYRAGGTDVPVADGGTGASTAAAAATNLGLGTGDSPQFTAVNIGAATDTTVARVSAGDISVEGNLIYRAGGTDVPVTDGGTGSSTAGGARANLGVDYGKQSIWIPAGAMTARSTNGAANGLAEMTTNKNMVKTLDFDTTTQEFAQFDIRMPKSWNESTVTFIPVWSHAATATNFGVVWGLDAVAVSDDDTLDVAFGTEQTSTDTGGTTNDSYQGPESSAITIAGTPAAGDLVMFRIHRNPASGSDTLAIDARLHGVLLLYTNDNTNDT